MEKKVSAKAWIGIYFKVNFEANAFIIITISSQKASYSKVSSILVKPVSLNFKMVWSRPGSSWLKKILFIPLLMELGWSASIFEFYRRFVCLQFFNFYRINCILCMFCINYHCPERIRRCTLQLIPNYFLHFIITVLSRSNLGNHCTYLLK